MDSRENTESTNGTSSRPYQKVTEFVDNGNGYQHMKGINIRKNETKVCSVCDIARGESIIRFKPS